MSNDRDWPRRDWLAERETVGGEMNDIVGRLRGRNEYHQHAPLYNEAADEIERLRDDAALALGEATRLLESFVIEHCQPVPEWKPLSDVIGVLSQLSNAVTIARDYKAEIERLQADNARLRGDVMVAYTTEMERLRTALQAIIERYEAEGDPDYMVRVARTALEGK